MGKFRVCGDYGVQDTMSLEIQARDADTARRQFIKFVKNNHPERWRRMGEHNVQVQPLLKMENKMDINRLKKLAGLTINESAYRPIAEEDFGSTEIPVDTTVPLSLPQLIEANDYHDFAEQQKLLQRLGVNVEFDEVGYENDIYLGLLHAGTPAHRKLVKQLMDYYDDESDDVAFTGRDSMSYMNDPSGRP